MLPDSMLPAFEGVVPSTIVTASADGDPNIANLSKVWRVSDREVAIADQMLNKTARNLREQPLALLRLPDPRDLLHWELEVRFDRSAIEGELFEQVQRELRAVEWMAGATDLAPLRSVLVFRVLSCRQASEDAVGPSAEWERYAGLLQELDEVLGWNRTSCWLTEENGSLTFAASRGIPETGSLGAGLDRLKRLAELVAEQRQPVRLRHVSSQLRYVRTIRSEAAGDLTANNELPSGFLGLPLFEADRLAVIVCCEGAQEDAGRWERFGEPFYSMLSKSLGEALAAANNRTDVACRTLFRQAIERSAMEWDKKTDPYETLLSARERQVALCVAQGMTNVEIAAALFISKRTATTHLERIYQKLDVHSRAALTRYVMDRGLLLDASAGAGNEQNT